MLENCGADNGIELSRANYIKLCFNTRSKELTYLKREHNVRINERHFLGKSFDFANVYKKV